MEQCFCCVSVPTWFSVFSSTDWPSSDCTSVFTGLCSLVGGWPGSESGSCMKNSWSLLLRLHLCSRSDRTSGSGSGGGLKIASDFFISISSGSSFTAGVIVWEARWTRFVHDWLLISWEAGIGRIIHNSALYVANKVYRLYILEYILKHVKSVFTIFVFCLWLNFLRNQIVWFTKKMDWSDGIYLCNVLLTWTAINVNLTPIWVRT